MKKSLIKIATLIMIMSLLFVTVISCDNNSVKVSNAIIYEVLSGEGATVERNGETDTVYAGMRIGEGDIIKTDKDSRVYIRLDDTKNILLEANSLIEVTKYSEGKLLITLVKGQCFFDVTEKLDDDEEMSFDVSDSTMSLRGTSGIVKATDDEGTFIILTGVGYVECNKTGEKTEFNLYPNVKATFGIEDNSFGVSYITEEDIPTVFDTYIESSETYKEELIEGGWEFDSEDATLPEEKAKNETENSLLGYRQDKNGNWVFNEQDYLMGYGPTYYGAIYNEVYPDKPELSVETASYVGRDITAIVTGYDSRYMLIENNVHKEPGVYTITVSPKGKWSDGTRDKLTIDWEIKYGEIELKTDTFEFEYTGGAQSYTLSSNFTDTTFEYSTGGSWSSTAPTFKEVGTNEVQVIASQKYCKSENTSITIKIKQATLTPYVSLKTNGSTITYNKDGGYYLVKKGTKISPKISFKNSDGKEFLDDITSNQTINVVNTDYYSTISGDVNEIYESSAEFLKGNTCGTYKYIITQKTTDARYQIVKTTFLITIEDDGEYNIVKITKQ